jgi:quinol monooxygenase YgiN
MRSSLCALFALVALTMAVTPAAADQLFHTATYVEVVPGAASQAASLLRAYRDASRGDTSALRLEVLQRVDRPAHFAIVGAWKDAPAFEAHVTAEATRRLRDGLAPLLASPDDERRHHGLVVAGAPAPAAAAGIYVVTHVDVIPPRKDDGVAALTQLATESRGDAGLVRFDVLQQTSRPNHFTVVEAWRDRPAADLHTAAPHTRQFRARLAPMSGALYDERLYAPLP